MSFRSLAVRVATSLSVLDAFTFFYGFGRSRVAERFKGAPIAVDGVSVAAG